VFSCYFCHSHVWQTFSASAIKYPVTLAHLLPSRRGERWLKKNALAFINSEPIGRKHLYGQNIRLRLIRSLVVVELNWKLIFVLSLRWSATKKCQCSSELCSYFRRQNKNNFFLYHDLSSGHWVGSPYLFSKVTYHIHKGCQQFDITFFHISLPPQGFGPEAKTRGGTLGVPACIHTRKKNICWKSKKCVCNGGKILDLTKLGAHGGLG